MDDNCLFMQPVLGELYLCILHLCHHNAAKDSKTEIHLMHDFAHFRASISRVERPSWRSILINHVSIKAKTAGSCQRLTKGPALTR
jgi:hypothetical protein